jgi:hypothetical protein
LANSIQKTVKPIGTTIVLTVLIWMYADQLNSENVTDLVSLQVLAPSGADFNVTIKEPENSQVQATFTGPREQFERLRRDLESGKFSLKYYVTPEDASSDTYIKDTTDILNSLLRKTYPGVSVLESKPPLVKGTIDHLISVTMPIRVITGTTKTSTPVITPDKAKVQISKSVYSELKEGERFIVVDIENELQDKPEDKAVDEEFPLPQTILGKPVITDPTRVRIQLQIQQQFASASFNLSKTQLMVLGPSELLSRYRVDIRDPQLTVVVRGPVEQIQRLDPQNIEAYLEIEPDDMYRQYPAYFPRQVKFLLPDGIKLDQENMSRPPEVAFKLIDQQAATPIAAPVTPR